MPLPCRCGAGLELAGGAEDSLLLDLVRSHGEWGRNAADASVEELATGLARQGHALVPIHDEVGTVNAHDLDRLVDGARLGSVDVGDDLGQPGVQRMPAAVEIAPALDGADDPVHGDRVDALEHRCTEPQLPSQPAELEERSAVPWRPRQSHESTISLPAADVSRPSG
jgi:hypothetical protein